MEINAIYGYIQVSHKQERMKKAIIIGATSGIGNELAKRILSSIKYQSLFFNFDNLQKKLLPIIALKHWPNQSIGSFT